MKFIMTMHFTGIIISTDVKIIMLTTTPYVGKSHLFHVRELVMGSWLLQTVSQSDYFPHFLFGLWHSLTKSVILSPNYPTEVILQIKFDRWHRWCVFQEDCVWRNQGCRGQRGSDWCLHLAVLSTSGEDPSLLQCHQSIPSWKTKQ